MHEIIWQGFANFLLSIINLVVIQVLVPVVALAAAGYLMMILRKLGIAKDAQTQLMVQRSVLELLQSGAQNIDHYAQYQISQKGPIKVDNPRVAALANFVIDQAPKRLKKLGYDPNTEKGQQAITQLAAAHLPYAEPLPPNSAEPAAK